MKNIPFPSITILILFLIFIPLTSLKAQQQKDLETKRVLVLYYDNKGAISSWIERFDNGLHAAFGERTGTQFELNIEYTDISRNPSKEYSDQLTSLLELKYGKHPPDVIIVNMNPASEFLLNLCNKIFPKAKIVFAISDTEFFDVFSNYLGKVTGVYMDMRHDGSPEIIARILPDTRNVFVITGNSTIELNDIKKVKDAFEKDNRFNVSYLIGMPVDEILKTANNLPSNSVIYYITYMGDPSQIPFLSFDVLSQISNNSNVPIFSFYDHYMGKGILGGNLISSEKMGGKAAELVLRILDGENPADIGPIKVESVNMFDWRQLQRWRIDEKTLPEGSIVQYREYTFFEKYKWRIIFWVSLVILQFILIAWLLMTLSRRRRAEKALSYSERKYRRLVESTKDAIISIDKNAEIRTCNMGATEMFGYSEDEIVGRPAMILAPEEERERQAANIKGVLEADSFMMFESIMAKRNGVVIPVKISLSAIKNESEEIIGIIAIIRDISEQKNAEEERKRLESALNEAQKMEAIGTLAGGIAHDFNNILTAIIGYTELAIFDIEKGSKEEANLHQVLKAGRRAKDLVNQILTFARKTHEEVKPILIGPIVDDALKLLRSTIPSSIEIRKNIETESLIMADRTRIHQIFLNICTNSVQSMENDGGVLTVSIKDIYASKNDGLKPGEYIKITISDTGAGIPKENLALIFDPYFTTKHAGEGTGLGLSVVHGIVEGYGGNIIVESEINRGTVFTIYLPATKLHPLEEGYTRQNLPRGSERILFVDDEPSIVEMVCQLLESMGYEVTCKNSSSDALELFREKPREFDLVITDMTMPHMNGDKLAAELIKIRSDIPVILCTGYSKTMTEATALRLGIKAFLMKPIEYFSLSKTVRDVLDMI